MYAVVLDRKRQIRVSPGQTLQLDYNESWETNREVVLDQVCMIGGDQPKIGEPFVEGAKVVLECVSAREKGDKIVVGKFKRRKGYRRKNGFRPLYSVVKVKEIQG
jgi:large subunit ribosomal protein L21